MPAPRSLVRSGVDVGPWLVANEITVVSTVPTLVALWPTESLGAVRLLIMGGEACPPEIGTRLGRPDRELWNTYGPTEATVVACAALLSGRGPVRIGLLLDGWDLAVIDEQGRHVAPGETGELIIGGVGLARYLGPVKDAEKYAPYPSLGWAPAYRSGDRVVYAEDGLFFAGRGDDQVKLGGRRIELGEVDNALLALDGVLSAAAAVRQTRSGNQLLVGYLLQFKVDLHGLRISKLTLNGRRTKYHHDKRGISVRVVEAIPAGEQFTVEVRYSGKPHAMPSKLLGPTGWEELTDSVIVSGQPHGAPSWFPCNDRPGNKASYSISISAPSGYRVVSNGRLVSTRRRSGSVIWVYDQSEPMATYLATVQIGRYSVVDVDAVVPLQVVVPGSLIPRYENAFSKQPQMLAFFSRMFGDYPFDNYTVVITEDDLEIPLESQGLSTFGANYLTQDWEAERLIAHEMSHQWFGNSLTLTDWADIWLHEGLPATANGCGQRSRAGIQPSSMQPLTGTSSRTSART